MVYNVNMHNTPNIIVENVLTRDQIDATYDSIKNPTNEFFFEFYGQSVRDFNLPEDVRARVISLAEQASGFSDLEIAEYQFSRYAPNDPENLPNLSPHFDGFTEGRITFDYQIGSNTSWALAVEGKEFVLKDNQALTFSGTHQIHWRLHKTFGPTDFVDMVFFHLKQKNATPNTAELKEIMQEKKDKYSEVWYNSINKGE
jgi:hypothetical protein